MEDVTELENKIEELSQELELAKEERNDLFVERDELKRANQDLSNALETARNEAQETAYRLSVVSNGIASLAQHTAYVGGQNNV